MQPHSKRVQNVYDLPAASDMLTVMVKWFLILFHPNIIVSVNIASVGDVMKHIDPAICSAVDVLFTNLQLFCSL